MRLAGQHGPLQRAVNQPLSRVARHPAARAVVSRDVHQEFRPTVLNVNPNPKAKNVAVLGGGITGLTTAFHLQRTLPDAKITIYEKQKQLGGWLTSEKIPVDGGEVLFEWGARTLRPDLDGAGLATLMLLVQLNITQNMISIPKTAPAATNRYVYYPDHLVTMPGPKPNSGPIMSMISSLYTMMTEPLFRGVIKRVLAEPTVAPRPTRIADESIGDFITRRFGSTVADNIFSAVLHGIYAGDLYKLSARTLLPMLWYAETRDPDGNGIVAELADLLFKNHSLKAYKDIQFRNLIVAANDLEKGNAALDFWVNSTMRNVSVYTFFEGVSFLSQSLATALANNERVTIRAGESIDELRYDAASNAIKIGAADDAKSGTYDYVVSTLSPGHMLDVLSSSAGSRSAVVAPNVQGALAKANKAVNVMVVNLYYPNPELIPKSQSGFGYLLPRSIPADQNPERALGVIFGSETSGLRGKDAVQKLPVPTQEQIDQLRQNIEELESSITPESKGQDKLIKTPLDNNKIHWVIERMKEDLNLARSGGEKELQFGQDTAPGTKLTVMMGGHWWDDWTESDLPSEDEAIDMAKSVLARHLKILEAPIVAKARLNKNCIPQYHVGYRQTMATIHEGLKEEFRGRLKVAGPWWQGGVGVNDCTRKARLAALSIREAWDETTGLEDYTKDEEWVLLDRRTGRVTMDPMTT